MRAPDVQDDVHLFKASGSLRSRRVLQAARIGVVFALSVLFTEIATAQMRDPEAIFEYAEQLEEARVDTHLGPSIIDGVFEPFQCFDAKMEEVGGPQVVGLYAPIYQTGTQTGTSDLLSQSLNIYGEWELLNCPNNEGTLYLFYLHESDSLGNSAGQFANAVGTTILPNDDVGNDSTRRDDYGMEMFWRLQLTENIQFTPDMQLYFDPSSNPTGDLEAAFGLRVGISF